MTTRVTERQQQVLEFIQGYIEENSFPPTLREICAHLGVSGTLSAMRHLDALEKKGHLKRSQGSRGITLTAPLAYTVALPIVGTVRAGAPTTAMEDISGYLSLDKMRLHGGRFFLRVRGDSMINASIRDGDLALVRPQPVAESRDIVVAMIDGEATLKRFYREKGHIRLQPENPNMAAIILPEGSADISIIGKVVGLYRDME